jgi:hypothetical protein
MGLQIRPAEQAIGGHSEITCSTDILCLMKERSIVDRLSGCEKQKFTHRNIMPDALSFSFSFNIDWKHNHIQIGKQSSEKPTSAKWCQSMIA